MREEAFDILRHARQRDMAELIMGYPASMMERFRFGEKGAAYVCADSAYALTPLAGDYQHFFSWAVRAKPKNIWLPRGTVFPFAAKATPFHFARLDAARGEFAADVAEIEYLQAEALLAARREVPEFTAQIRTVDLQTLLISHVWRVFCLWEDGRIVSSATAARIRSGVYKVQSVMTVEGARRRGLARHLLLGMLHALSGSKLLLMYESDAAGALYHSLGFADFAEVDLFEQE